jgi:hypothetical protein
MMGSCEAYDEIVLICSPGLPAPIAAGLLPSMHSAHQGFCMGGHSGFYYCLLLPHVLIKWY